MSPGREPGRNPKGSRLLAPGGITRREHHTKKMITLTDTMSTPIKSSTTHVVLTTGRSRDTYTVWSEHKSEESANKRVSAMAANGSEGHTVAVAVAQIGKYKLA